MIGGAKTVVDIHVDIIASCLLILADPRQVPLEVRSLRRAVHQFGLVGGEDYDSKVSWVARFRSLMREGFEHHLHLHSISFSFILTLATPAFYRWNRHCRTLGLRILCKLQKAT